MWKLSWTRTFSRSWSHLVLGFVEDLVLIQYFNYWTVCSQEPLVAGRSYIHRLSALWYILPPCIKRPLCMGRTLFPSMASLALQWIEQTREWSWKLQHLFLEMMMWRKKTHGKKLEKTSDTTSMCYVVFTGVSGIERVTHGISILDVVNGRVKLCICW